MFKVKFMKYFVNGMLKGIAIDAELTFSDLDNATRYMGFLIAHTETPVKAIGSSDYTCHVIRMT